MDWVDSWEFVHHERRHLKVLVYDIEVSFSPANRRQPISLAVRILDTKILNGSEFPGEIRSARHVCVVVDAGRRCTGTIPPR